MRVAALILGLVLSIVSGIQSLAIAAGDDPDVLRMENLDTDIPPSEEAMEATRAASLFTVSPTRGRVT